MEEIAPPPSTPEPREGSPPWIERASTTGLIILVTVPTDALYMYCEAYQRMTPIVVGFIVLAWIVGNLLLYLPWAGLWTLISKVSRGRAHFLGHLNTALLAGLTWTWTRTSLGAAIFAFSADAYRMIPYYLLFWLIFSIALWGHLRLVLTTPVRRLAGTTGLIAAFLVGLVAGARTLTVRQSPAIKTADTTLLPPFLRLAGSVSIRQHLDSLADLQASVDARAKENKPH